jgi:hypothetical protein
MPSMAFNAIRKNNQIGIRKKREENVGNSARTTPSKIESKQAISVT